VNSLAYKFGQDAALTTLGFKEAADFGGTSTPYPHKSQQIPAERIARALQQLDDEPEHIPADNRGAGKWDRPVSWNSPVNLSGLDTGEGTGGIIAPGNPRS
jgi:hypothetical protein